MEKLNKRPPLPTKIAKKMMVHGHDRIDHYYWLNDANNPQVIDYLQAENDHFEAYTSHTKAFQESLFEEMRARIKEDDSSVPFKLRGYYYITRYEKGSQYPIHTRKKGSLAADEEIMFNVPEMAQGFAYYNLSGVSVSPNNKLVSFGVDTLSRRQYTLCFKNLETGLLYPEKIENTTGNAVWANDNKTIFYTQKNPDTLRSEKIFRHVLGTDPSTDTEIYHEQDEAFGVYVQQTKSRKYLLIGAYSTLSTEYRFLAADDPLGQFELFQQRERGLEYSIAHYEDHFYILTNKDKATNFTLMKTPETRTTQDCWETVIPHRQEVLLEDFSIFKDFMVLEERFNGLCNIRIRRWDGTEDYCIPFAEETYTAGVYSNPEFDTDQIRYSYHSMTTPHRVIDFKVTDRSEDIVKEQVVLGNTFDKNNYVSKRLWATAADGTEIPISLVYHKQTNIGAHTPLLLYGYGAYGYTLDAGFSTTRLSLLDRGFIYAIAHIRGSEYLGRKWYEQGRLLHKKNSFTDFIAVAKYLVGQAYTSPEHLYAQGGSAGGLLMGAVINMAPGLFNGVIAAVPFVDVLTTMLDERIPLTTGEFDEWGNPNAREYYAYIHSYSPYDNITRQVYPHLLVTTGLYDSQVQYFEPAKWVAKLREYKTDNNRLLFHTDMETGHGGASGRFDAIKETARDITFLLDLESKAVF